MTWNNNFSSNSIIYEFKRSVFPNTSEDDTFEKTVWGKSNEGLGMAHGRCQWAAQMQVKGLNQLSQTVSMEKNFLWNKVILKNMCFKILQFEKNNFKYEMFSLNIITRELRVSSASLNVFIRIVGQIPFLKISCWEKEGNVFKHIVNSITHPTSNITCWAVRLLPQLPTPWVSLLHCTPSMAEPKPQDWTGRWLQVDGGLGVWSL